MTAPFSRTAVVTSDTAVKSAAGEVYWIAHFAGATGGLWQLNDSTDDSGTDRFSGNSAATSAVETVYFDPPILCEAGIFLDVPGTNVTLSIGYN